MQDNRILYLTYTSDVGVFYVALTKRWVWSLRKDVKFFNECLVLGVFQGDRLYCLFSAHFPIDVS